MVRASTARRGAGRSRATAAAQASFSLPQLDLAPWLGHWPAALPVRLLRGRIGTELKLDFDARSVRRRWCA